ncbi:hypothetical protein SPBR_03548 [Sporothrix brasiliensis 5110]|uniref:Aminoglycoside phosphotransferase domain-containing protein n=1 Tax=Sporothrix brasiliensis 5110 TaxID=1398154 RepID=A0A0C2FVV7_9PEZI|nr:uncharacterized protein SPBR_03548 [Sporothrix brasiliensis 5110]KIH95123.1 hypothetical protein SPBR_03548 [Sporothrix brasiliensis 5110]
MVPNHTDLLENNIHVDPATGHITGICDWKDAEVSPFGTSLEGLESLLGERTTTGWRWVTDSRELRRAFWDAFAAIVGPGVDLERVGVARLVGIFVKYGFVWVDRENKRLLTESDNGSSFLDAITLGVEDIWVDPSSQT